MISNGPPTGQPENLCRCGRHKITAPAFLSASIVRVFRSLGRLYPLPKHGIQLDGGLSFGCLHQRLSCFVAAKFRSNGIDSTLVQLEGVRLSGGALLIQQVFYPLMLIRGNTVSEQKLLKLCWWLRSPSFDPATGQEWTQHVEDLLDADVIVNEMLG